MSVELIMGIIASFLSFVMTTLFAIIAYFYKKNENDRSKQLDELKREIKDGMDSIEVKQPEAFDISKVTEKIDEVTKSLHEKAFEIIKSVDVKIAEIMNAIDVKVSAVDDKIADFKIPEMPEVGDLKEELKNIVSKSQEELEDIASKYVKKIESSFKERRENAKVFLNSASELLEKMKANVFEYADSIVDKAVSEVNEFKEEMTEKFENTFEDKFVEMLEKHGGKILMAIIKSIFTFGKKGK